MAEQLPVKKEEYALVRLEDREGDFGLVRKDMHVDADLCFIMGSDRHGVKSGCISAQVFDRLATEMAVKFSDPEIVEEEEWKVKIKVDCEYYNPQGKMIRDSEIYENDVWTIYQQSRTGWESREGRWEKTKKGKSYFVPDKKASDFAKVQYETGNPIVHYELPPDVEADEYKKALTLKRFKIAKAITCAHRRLMQRATGIKGFKTREDNPKNIKIPYWVFKALGKPESMEVVDEMYGAETKEADFEVRDEPKQGTRDEPPQTSEEPSEGPESGPDAAPLGYVVKVSGPGTFFVKDALKPLKLWEGETQTDEFRFEWGLPKNYGKAWVCEGLSREEAIRCSDGVWNLPDKEVQGSTVYNTKAVNVEIVEMEAK